MSVTRTLANTVVHALTDSTTTRARARLDTPVSASFCFVLLCRFFFPSRELDEIITHFKWFLKFFSGSLQYADDLGKTTEKNCQI